VKFNESFHDPILGNDKYKFKSVQIHEVGIEICIKRIFSEKSKKICWILSFAPHLKRYEKKSPVS